jgi:antitoxin CptB
VSDSGDNAADLRRLRWRCRRGMRELDMLLLAYLDRRYGDAGTAEQQAFRQLLTLPDPEILGLLTGRSRADDTSLQDVIECLLDYGGTG